MSRYFLSPLAESDLNNIHDYIAADNPDAALRISTHLQEACQQLARMPEMGRARDELALGLRSFPVGYLL